MTLDELGSNGENECSVLPVGVDIKTASGPFADRWERIALQSETPPVIESDSSDRWNDEDFSTANEGES
ncbi:hypothetical protein [Rhizobium leguminosarum]|uniref:hypothetical protein n=1 Tax=Rhizobium leguminosarum TaxID=384 RepID=UPI003F9D0C74